MALLAGSVHDRDGKSQGSLSFVHNYWTTFEFALVIIPYNFLTLRKMSEAKLCMVSPASISKKSCTVLKWSNRWNSVCRICIRQPDA